MESVETLATEVRLGLREALPAQGVTEHCQPNVRLFARGVMTDLDILYETGHAEPWIIAMDCPPTRAAVLDYGAPGCIEPMLSDFKSRGFALKNSQLERLVLIMASAMHWCVHIGRLDAAMNPMPLEKKHGNKPTLSIGVLESSSAV